jgi:hypothetical protein
VWTRPDLFADGTGAGRWPERVVNQLRLRLTDPMLAQKVAAEAQTG